MGLCGGVHTDGDRYSDWCFKPILSVLVSVCQCEHTIREHGHCITEVIDDLSFQRLILVGDHELGFETFWDFMHFKECRVNVTPRQ